MKAIKESGKFYKAKVSACHGQVAMGNTAWTSMTVTSSPT